MDIVFLNFIKSFYSLKKKAKKLGYSFRFYDDVPNVIFLINFDVESHVEIKINVESKMFWKTNRNLSFVAFTYDEFLFLNDIFKVLGF